MAAGMWIDPQDASKINQTSDLYMTQTIASGEKLMITFPYKSSFSCVI